MGSNLGSNMWPKKGLIYMSYSGVPDSKRQVTWRSESWMCRDAAPCSVVADSTRWQQRNDRDSRTCCQQLASRYFFNNVLPIRFLAHLQWLKWQLCFPSLGWLIFRIGTDLLAIRASVVISSCHPACQTSNLMIETFPMHRVTQLLFCLVFFSLAG